MNSRTRSSGGLLTALPILAVLAALAIWHHFAGRRSGDSSVATDDGTGSLPQLLPVPTKIAPGIFSLGDMFPSSVYAVETSAGLALVDSGLEAEHGRLLAGLSQFGLDIGQLKMVLLTHAHGDHTMGAERLRRETGAKIYIGRDDAGPLREGGPWEAIFSKFEMPGVTIHPTTVDGELVDGQVLSLGEAQFTVIATPGHTTGSCCYLLELGDLRALFTGDVVMSLGSLGTYSAYLPPKFRGNAHDYLASLEKLRTLPAPDLVLPGHPEGSSRPRDPRLTSDEWQALLGLGIEELQRLTVRYRQDGEDFLDGIPKKLAKDLFYLGDLEGGAVYAAVSGERTLLFDAARGPRSAEFIDAAWKELGVVPPPTAAVLLTSCVEENLTGLRAIVESTPCQVVVSPAGKASAKQHCHKETSVLSSDELELLEWNGLESLPVPGLDTTAMAYLLRTNDEQVLVSGEMPLEGSPEEMNRVFEGLFRERWDPEQFSASLDALAKISPKLWLSAKPMLGRNANLYDDDWLRTILRNKDLLRSYRLMSGTAAR